MMDTKQQSPELHVTRTDHADGWTVTVDLHPLTDEDVTVEVLGDTAVVAVDTPTVRTEFDVPLPESGGHTSLHNGVLTIESGA
jgi:hypothetical protein